jgi:hypothetical protein
MLCKFCHKKIPDNSKFCRYCGGNLNETDFQKKAEKRIGYSNHANLIARAKRTTIDLIITILILINFFSGIVGGIWLSLTGRLSLVVYGIILSIIMPWLYTIIFIPQFALMTLVGKVYDKGNKILISILGFLASAYGNLILVIWTVFVFKNLVIQQTHSLIPLLLWGYSTTMAPLSYMASKEPPDSSGTSMGLLFSQLSYLLLTILFILNSTILIRNFGLGVLIGLFSLITVSRAINYMSHSRR